MSILFIFNPSHDEALAFGGAHYTPTAAARRLAADCARLPLLWAGAGDVVLPADGMAEEAGTGRRMPVAEAVRRGITLVSPWGWDAHLTDTLRRLGIPPTLLPPPDRLERLRRLSGRTLEPELIGICREAAGRQVVGTTYRCHSREEALERIDELGGTAVVKAPWSCSGRGVFMVGGPQRSREGALRRLCRIIQRQGGVNVERRYERVLDFAVELQARPDGTVGDDGLSLFSTSPDGHYGGNLVAPEATLLQLIPADLQPTLKTVRRTIAEALAERLAGTYIGPLGVDMMVVRLPDGTAALHPCVEVNLRRTMGHVALALRRFVRSDASPAFFALRPDRNGHIVPTLTTADGHRLALPGFGSGDRTQGVATP